MNSKEGSSDTLFSGDFSRFDTTISSDLLNIVFEELQNIMVDAPYRPLSKDFEAISDCFINSKVLMPDGFVYQKSKGICSGSMFTNLIGSLINLTLSRICAASVGLELVDSGCSVLGDDSSLQFSSSSFSNDSLEKYCKEFSK